MMANRRNDGKYSAAVRLLNKWSIWKGCCHFFESPAGEEGAGDDTSGLRGALEGILILGGDDGRKGACSFFSSLGGAEGTVLVLRGELEGILILGLVGRCILVCSVVCVCFLEGPFRNKN